MKKLFFLILLDGLFISCIFAKETTCLSSCSKNKLFIPIVAIEAWGIYTKGEEKSETEYANNFDVQLRRLRFGAEGMFSEMFRYSFCFHNDRLGESSYAGTKGSHNGVEVWNAYLSIRPLISRELINIHVGYFWAAISREYNTCPWTVSSFDKAYSNWYLRNFITGKGNGIESGIGVGGLRKVNKFFGVSYRAGIFQPEKHNSVHYSNPLIVGRIMLSFGDPEEKKYKYMLSGNQWNERKGVTIGIGSAYQGKTDNEKEAKDHIFFDKSKAYGVDLLINFGGLIVDGEYFDMKREALGVDGFNGTEWHARISYRVKFGERFIEPSFMTSKYKGEGEKKLYKYMGGDITHDIGINLYLNKTRIKQSLHYVTQKGSASSNQGDYFGFAVLYKL